MVVSAVETTSVSSATMKEATAARARTHERCVMERLDGAGRANPPVSFGRRRCLTVHEHPAGRRSPGRRRARVPDAGRALPPRARGPLLPHARLGPRRRGRRPGHAAARLALASSASRAARRSRPGCTGSPPTPASTSSEKRPRRVVEPYPDERLAGRRHLDRRSRRALRAARGHGARVPDRDPAPARPPARDPDPARRARLDGRRGRRAARDHRDRGQQRAAARAGDDRGRGARARRRSRAPDAARAAAALRRRLGARGHERAGRAAARGRGADDAARGRGRRRRRDRRVLRARLRRPDDGRAGAGSTTRPRSSCATPPAWCTGWSCSASKATGSLSCTRTCRPGTGRDPRPSSDPKGGQTPFRVRVEGASARSTTRATSTREETPSLWKRLRRCVSTVLVER